MTVTLTATARMSSAWMPSSVGTQGFSNSGSSMPSNWRSNDGLEAPSGLLPSGATSLIGNSGTASSVRESKIRTGAMGWYSPPAQRVQPAAEATGAPAGALGRMTEDTETRPATNSRRRGRFM